jgi:hypothetical protein
VLIGIQDIHGGSDVAICGPDGMTKDTGQTVMPSPLQRQLWTWFEEVTSEAAELVADVRPSKVILAINGDVTDGDHHGTSQIISPLESMHVRVAHRVLTYLMDKVPPDAVHMTRGTPAHVGKAGTLEEGLARVLLDKGYPMVEDPDTTMVTSYHRRYMLGGLLVDQRHHGRMGQRAHTRDSYLVYYAQDIELEHRLDGVRPPDLALRAHNHVYGDSGRPHRKITRVIAGPCWQATTEWGHRGAFETLPSIGIYAIVVDRGVDTVHTMLRQPLRPSIAE